MEMMEDIVSFLEEFHPNFHFMEDYTGQFQGALRTLNGTGKLNFIAVSTLRTNRARFSLP